MDVIERFLSYVAYPTMSDEPSQAIPSTQKQKLFGERIVRDLKEIGLTDAYMDEYGYVYATLESNNDNIKNTVGFIAHMDTSSEASDENINPKIITYTGKDIILNEVKNYILSAERYPALRNYEGMELIVTDGTTLLGADDKAGIAEIINAVENIIKSNKPHGKVKLGFTPDEEIGRGADKFDIHGFSADYAYTIDGGRLGEIEYENFNAASVNITFNGISIHPGDAKDKMINAALLACEFNAALPNDEIPSKTSGYEGFHHLISIEGSVEKAQAYYIIRDHDSDKFHFKKDIFAKIASDMNEKYGSGTVKLEISDSYFNMKEKIKERFEIVEFVKCAMEKAHVKPDIVPIRGGTDGAKLSFNGLLCPNICTGGENFHSRFEYIPVNSLKKVTEIIENIILDTK